MSTKNPQSALAFCPLNVERFNGSPKVRRLGGFARGIYVLLLLEEWSLQGRGLPSEDWALAAVVNLSPDDWAAVRDEVLEFFDEGLADEGQEPTRLYNATCEEAIATAIAYRDRARENGKKGGRPRAGEEND